MKVVIIGNEKEINLLNISKFEKEYSNVEFIISEDMVDTSKDDLIIFMKEVNDYNVPGIKSLFLEKEIDAGNNFFLIVFGKIDSNIEKIKFLLNIFLD